MAEVARQPERVTRFEGVPASNVQLMVGAINASASQCVWGCGADVHTPMGLSHLVDRYTRSEEVDGVTVPVDIRGIRVDTRWCVGCVDTVFDQACLSLGIHPTKDVRSRLSLSREELEAAIASRRASLHVSGTGLKGGGGSVVVDKGGRSRRNRVVKRERRRRVQEARLVENSGRAELDGLGLRELKRRLSELDKLRADGIPNDDVPRICDATRGLIEQYRNVPLGPLAFELAQNAKPHALK